MNTPERCDGVNARALSTQPSIRNRLKARNRGDYTVGWICALPIEFAAAEAMLDSLHETPPQDPTDHNTYTLGAIGQHNVAMACLPKYGTTNAAIVANNMGRSFPSLQVRLMVGIGGAVPGTPDVRLGDIVVGNEVVQYDFGKAVRGGQFQLTRNSAQPPPNLGTAVATLRGRHESTSSSIPAILEQFRLNPSLSEYSYPGSAQDVLYDSSYYHEESRPTCAQCDPSRLVVRSSRSSSYPEIHYGIIASGNQVMKDAEKRDEIASKVEAICFEMEAAGLINHFPCLVIRGISDYCDSHKNKHWQRYAAATAAAYAKELLCTIAPTTRKEEDITAEDPRSIQCLADLRITDSRDDKSRIQESKGGLLRDAYSWVLDHPDFQQWRRDPDTRLLWIRGDPGKGKTMLMCGIIDELERSETMVGLYYFFCQATDSRLNHATAVLRGLIYQIVTQQPSLLTHVRCKYDHAGKALFEDINAWAALSNIFSEILRSSNLAKTMLIVDGLDECSTDLPRLLELITKTTLSAHVKWIVSSRNWPFIESSLNTATHQIRLHLELNKELIAHAVHVYIQYKVDWLARRKSYKQRTRDVVLAYLTSHADDTFLWVALVCHELDKVTRLGTEDKLKTFPPGLDSLYARMLQLVNETDVSQLCIRVLAVTLITYRPLSLKELLLLDQSFENDLEDLNDLEEVIAYCGSFLTTREGFVYFIHQSAKDFLLQKASGTVLPSGLEEEHYNLGLRSIGILNTSLQRNIYDLDPLGVHVNSGKLPNPDPLSAIRYACVHSIDHLNYSMQSCEERLEEPEYVKDITLFFEVHFLHWLEALGHLKSMSHGIRVILRHSQLQGSKTVTKLTKLVNDASRFMRYCKDGIESHPLQAYSSALLFSPTESLMRQLYREEVSSRMEPKTALRREWDACLQTLEGHSSAVNSVAFAPDGRQVASASVDNTAKIWDAVTGACLQTLEGHDSSVISIAFGPDSQRAVSVSFDFAVKIWDVVSGTCLQTLRPRDEELQESSGDIALASDSRQVTPAVKDRKVKFWDPVTGTCHEYPFSSVVFSLDSQDIVSALWDKTVKVWEKPTGAYLQTLENHGFDVFSAVISPNGRQMASAQKDEVKIWDTVTCKCLQTLAGHGDYVNSVVFSPDGRQAASTSHDRTVKIWDIESGACLQTLKGHSDDVNTVAFTRQGQQIASASHDRTIKIWDTAGSAYLETIEGHGDYVNSVTFAPDGRRTASASNDHTVKIWSAATGTHLQVLEGHSDTVTSVAFAPNSRQVVSGSHDRTSKIWDVTTGMCLQTLDHESCVKSVAFSSDGRQLVSGSVREVKIWDPVTGARLLTLDGHSEDFSEPGSEPFLSVILTPDGRRVAWAFLRRVKIWDVVTKACLHVLNHQARIASIAFAPDGGHLASASEDCTVRIWDTATGTCIQTLEDRGTNLDWFKVPPGSYAYGMSHDNSWITYNGRELLWLPTDFRPSRPSALAFTRKSVMIGTGTGRVLILSETGEVCLSETTPPERPDTSQRKRTVIEAARNRLLPSKLMESLKRKKFRTRRIFGQEGFLAS